MNKIGDVVAVISVGALLICAVIHTLRRRDAQIKCGMTFRELMDDNICAAGISLF